MQIIQFEAAMKKYKHFNRYKTVYILCTLVFVVMISVIVGIFNFKKEYIHLAKEALYKEAIAHYDNMVNTRLWNSEFGGVFVYKTDKLEPNPYLKNNHIYTKDNEVLVKINPAWMTRQISEISNLNGEYYYKITSLKPLNPTNQPDAFEKEALEFFEKNKKIRYYTKFENEKYNFMGSLVVTQSCLQCHEHQNYKLGDIRGGLRISIPTTTYDKNIDLINANTKFFVYLIIIMSVLLILVIIYFLNLIYKKQEEIIELNENLEDKVKDRTNEIQSMLEHEQYLKNVLGLVSDVNEILLQSYSYQSIIKNSIQKLIQHKNYKFIWTGYLGANEFKIIYKTDDINDLIPENNYPFLSSNQCIKKAIEVARTKILTTHEVMHEENNFTRRADDIQALHVMALPYNYNNSNAVFCVYSNRPEGFDEEEIEMLKKIVLDIEISIKAQSQKDEIKKMEMEKVSNYEETILAFVNVIEKRDTYTAGHTIRVAQYCRLIAEELKLEEHEIKKLEQAAILHDIGKVAIPDSILLKPGQLTALEYDLIKYHSEAGYEMLSKIEMYKGLAETIRYHHSRYDGLGYPKTNHPDEIPFLSHIMIVADAFDAMTTNRIYKPRKNIKEALEEINECSGVHFHPKVVEATLKCLKDVELNQTSQLPTNELESKRFSYFFNDYLTGVYNEHYLQPVLFNDTNQIKFLYNIEIKRFSTFNKQFGWDEGNTLLKLIAQTLLNIDSKSFVFRFHGDDFIVLSQNKENIKNLEKTLKKLIENTPLDIKIKEYEVDKSFDFKVLQ